MTTWQDIVQDNRFVPEYLPKFESKLYFEGATAVRQHTNFFVLLALATIIATFGLISDSTATVIGAMIVAPLMTPIMAASAAIVMGNPRRTLRSLALVLVGTVFVVCFSAGLALVSATSVHAYGANPEILSRTTPNLMALVIALAAGAAGAFAIGREEVSDSLPGVAIAISLVPPLSVVGISLSQSNWPDAMGALLLFLTNFLAILLAGGVVLAILGLGAAVRSTLQPAVRRNAFIAVAIGMLILTALLFLTGYRTTQQVLESVEAQTAVESWLANLPYTVASISVKGSQVNVTIAGSGQLPPLDTLAASISLTVGRPVTVSMRVIPEQSLVFPQKTPTSLVPAPKA